MSKLKSRVGLSILAVVVGGLATYTFWEGLWPDESLEGRLRQLTSRWASSRRSAAEDLSRFTADSEKVVPALVAAVEDPDREVQRASLETLANFGDKAEPAGPALRSLLEKAGDPETRSRAAGILGTIKDKEAVPILVKTLGDSNPLVQTAAVKSLGQFGKGASSAATVDTLLSFLKSDHPPDLRGASVDALGAIAKDEERVIRSLADVAIKDASFQVRKKAVNLLGSKFDFGVDALVKALDDPNSEVQIAAGTKMAWIGMADDRTAPALCHAALTARKETKEAIGMNLNLLLILDKFDDKADPEKETRRFHTAVAEFRKVLETPEAAAQESIAKVLGRLIVIYVNLHRASLLEPARAAVDALVASMEDEKADMKLRIEAADQWEIIQLALLKRKANASEGEDELHATTSWVKAFGRLIKGPSKEMSSKALALLSESFRFMPSDESYRAAWRELAPTIAETAKSEDEKVRGPALKILADLGPEAIGALAMLQSMAEAAKDPALRARIEKTIRVINSMDDLKSTSPEKRAAAAMFLGQLGWRADNAKPGLLAALQDPEAKVRAAAAAAFGGLGTGGASAITPLTNMTASDPDPTVRDSALASLKAISPGSPNVVEIQLKALNDADYQVRKTAALFPKGPPGKPVVKALTAALADSSDEVAQTAATSLARGLFDGPEPLTALLSALDDPRQRKNVLPAIDSHLEEKDARGDFNRFRSKAKDLETTVGPAIPILRHALTIEDQEVSTMVYRLLGRILKSAGLIQNAEYSASLAPAVDLYLGGLEKGDADRRVEIFANLDDIPVRRVEIVNALLVRLKEPRLPAKDRATALQALAVQAATVEDEADLKKALRAAIPILIESVESEDLDLKLAAIRAVGRIGGDARAATSALRRLAKGDPTSNVRELADMAIKAVNGTAKMPPAPPRGAGGGMEL